VRLQFDVTLLSTGYILAREADFTCFIDDLTANERFSATVVVSKKIVMEVSRDKGKVEIAHIYITPISDHF